MTDGFELSVPTDAQFRGLASELAGRYARLAGGSEADAASLAAEVADAVERAAAAADQVTIVCRGEASGIGIVLRAGGRSIEVHRPLHARRS